MLFQFFVNKCTQKIDTLYNTQQKKNTYTVDNFFGVIISIRQQQIIKNKTKKKQKKQKKQKNNKKKTIEQYRKQRDNNHKFRGEISDDAQDFSNRRRIILK